VTESDGIRPRPASGGRTLPRRASRRRLTLAAALLALALFAAFVVLAALAGPHSALSAWDARVTAAFVGWRTPGRSHLFWAMTLIGNDQVLAALSASAVILLAVWGRRAWAGLVAVGLLVGWGISEAAKTMVGRERPPAASALIALPSSHSMPSGHALTTLVFLGTLLYVAWRAGRRAARGGAAAGAAAPRAAAQGGAGIWVAFAAVAALVFTGLIGVSRVYLGVHWLSDVIGGWCLGGAWLAAYLGVLWGGVGRRLAVAAGRYGVRHHVVSFFSDRAPARVSVRAGAVAFVVVICVVAVIFGALSDRLLANV
jgi:undecaprenyl-diphosphatase